MNNSENPNNVQPINTPVENPVVPAVTEVPAVGPTSAPAPVEVAPPTMEATTVPAPVNSVPTVNPLESATPEVLDNDPRAVGIDNSEFIHPEAFDKMASHKEEQNKDVVVDENLKKVEVEYTPPSKFKMGFMIFLFIFLIAFVIFLPDITSYVDLHLSGNNEDTGEKITNGRMRCSLTSTTTNLDKIHEFVFSFTNNQLDKLEYTITTKGDPSLDATTLDTMSGVCKQLSQDTEAIIGVTVRCKYTEGKLVETQTYDLQNVDMTEVRSAFTEAGGMHPEYPYGQDMDVIEGSMKASGYDCEREY